MKTKISHLGRSTVSVILAVMMLLSTMLIGTVSTVNAAINLKGTYYFDNTDANWDNVYMVFIGTNDTYKKYNKMSVSEGKYYKYDQSAKWDANGFYFTNSSNGSSDGTNKTNIFSTNPDSSKNCFVPTSSSGSGTWMSLEDAKASHKSSVADSVTLEANPTSVKVGNSVTLTPTVSSAKPGNLTYTYNKISGGTATEVKNADNSLTVTPTAAGTYEYTVTVSANGYSDVTSAKVTITASYTATQQAYVDLENYVNSVKDTNAGSYTDDSFADFSTALKSAQALLTGLPNADASDTEKYTTALNDLTVAYKNLKSNKQYYILGHSAITGGADTSSETTHNNGVPMKDNGNGDYTYTFSSPDIKSGNDAFCFIDNNDKTYKTDNDQSINITDSTVYCREPVYCRNFIGN